MSHLAGDAFDEERLKALEASIFAARGLISTSDDHRPRTMEGAAEACAQKKNEQRIRGFVLSMLLLGTFSGQLGHYVTSLQAQFAVPKSTEVQLRATQLARENAEGVHWALTDALFELRMQQSSLLFPTREPNAGDSPFRGNSLAK